jgi:hypothetical protein
VATSVPDLGRGVREESPRSLKWPHDMNVDERRVSDTDFEDRPGVGVMVPLGSRSTGSAIIFS